MDAFLLGLSSGASCLASCAPFLAPLIAVQGDAGQARKAGLVALFLAGRLAAYVIVGFLAGSAGVLAAGYLSPALDRLLLRAGWALGGVVLLLGGLAGFKGPSVCGFLAARENLGVSAAALGLAAGLNVCPPFVAAASRAVGLGPGGGVLYFAIFFVGTSVWTLPFALIPALKRHAAELRSTARITMVLLGSYFLFTLGILGWS